MTRSIQTVVRRQCRQLRGQLHSQRLILQNLEKAKNPSEAEISKVRDAVEITLRKLQDLGCDSAQVGG